MVSPRAAYARLLAREEPGLGGVARRGLTLALFLGAFLSLVNASHLGPSPLVGSVLSWTFVPALRLLAVALVARLVDAPVSWRRACDLHGAAQGPWCALALLLAALQLGGAAGPPNLWFFRPPAAFVAGLAVALAVSLRARLAFAQVVLGLSPGRARLALALVAALFWGAVLSFFLLTRQLLPRLLPA